MCRILCQFGTYSHPVTLLSCFSAAPFDYGARSTESQAGRLPAVGGINAARGIPSGLSIRNLTMRNMNLTILAGILVALFLAGCASAPERALSRDAPPYPTFDNGRYPLKPDQLSPLFNRPSTAVEEGGCPFYER